MVLLEQTNNDSIQSYIKPTSPDVDKSTILKIILSNILKRFKDVTEGEIDKEDFKNNLAPNLTLKVIKLKPEGESNGIYIANLNQKTNAKEQSVSPRALELFKEAGIDMPSDRILSSRLKEINYSDLDPIRLTGIDYEVIYSSTLSDEVEYEDLDFFAKQFDDYVKAYDHREYTYEDKIKSVYVLSLNKNLTNAQLSEMNDPFLESITEDIEDRNIRINVKEHLKTFLDQPTRRAAMLDEADHILKELSQKESNKSGSSSNFNIPIWKLIITISLFILAYIGIRNSKTMSNVWSLVKGYTDEKDRSSLSKAKLYFKVLFSRKGRANANLFQSGKKNSELGMKTLEEIKKQKILAKFKIKSGNIDMNRAKRFLDGYR